MQEENAGPEVAKDKEEQENQVEKTDQAEDGAKIEEKGGEGDGKAGKAQEPGPDEKKEEGSAGAVSPPSPLSHKSSEDENVDAQSSGTDNEADAKEQLFQQAVEAQVQEPADNAEPLGAPAVKKNDSDNNLLTLEDRVKASPRNFQIAEAADVNDFKDPMDQMMQESQVVNPLLNPPTAAGDKDEEDDEDYDIFADSESKTHTATAEPGSKGAAGDEAPALSKNAPFAGAGMSQVFNPMAQSQHLDQSAVAQSAIMMEQSSIMNQSLN